MSEPNLIDEGDKSWCGICEESMPDDFQEHYEKYHQPTDA